MYRIKTPILITSNITRTTPLKVFFISINCVPPELMVKQRAMNTTSRLKTTKHGRIKILRSLYFNIPIYSTIPELDFHSIFMMKILIHIKGFKFSRTKKMSRKF